jgi:hypothetical protein
MADRRIFLSALVASRLGLAEPVKAAWVPRARPPYVGYTTQRRRHRGGMIPSESEFGMTADVVIDDPREPRIEPIGIFDARGKMLCRVTVPVRGKMGFHTSRTEVLDEVSTIVPEDMLAISEDTGAGLASVDIDDMEADFEDEDEEGEA